jgi:hypothetical protein
MINQGNRLTQHVDFPREVVDEKLIEDLDLGRFQSDEVSLCLFDMEHELSALFQQVFSHLVHFEPPQFFALKPAEIASR